MKRKEEMKFMRRPVKDAATFIKMFCPWLSAEERLRFGVVDDGICYRSAQPRKSQFEYLIQKYQFRSLVVIRTHLAKHEAEIAKKHGLRILQIPLYGNRTPAPELVQLFITHAGDPQNQPMLLHCKRGRDRTGLFTLLYRLEICGWSFEDAWQEMFDYGHAAYFGRSPYRNWIRKRYNKTSNSSA